MLGERGGPHVSLSAPCHFLFLMMEKLSWEARTTPFKLLFFKGVVSQSLGCKLTGHVQLVSFRLPIVHQRRCRAVNHMGNHFCFFHPKTRFLHPAVYTSWPAAAAAGSAVCPLLVSDSSTFFSRFLFCDNRASIRKEKLVHIPS